MKTAFVTGGGNGLGKGFVDYFLDQGFLVFSGEHNPSNETEKYKNLRAISLDVSNDSSINRIIQAISTETKHLDILVNNAGVNKDTATENHKELVCNLENLDRMALLKMFNINAISPFILLQKCLPLLELAEKAFIINISSDRASFHDELENTSGNYGYRASKIALNMMTFCSLLDLPENIKTFAVHPGSVQSNMNPSGSNQPVEQAKRIFAITKDWKEDLNGKFLRFDGSYYPL